MKLDVIKIVIGSRPDDENYMINFNDIICGILEQPKTVILSFVNRRFACLISRSEILLCGRYAENAGEA